MVKQFQFFFEMYRLYVLFHVECHKKRRSAEDHMNNNLFRKKNVEKSVSPEQLNDYIHISNPSVWIILAAFTLFLVGVCIWGIFGRLDTTLSVVAVKDDNRVVCFVKEADREKIQVGMPVEIGNETFTITGIEKTPVPVDASIPKYAKHIGNLADGEWIYFVYIDGHAVPEGTIFSAKITIEQSHPLYFIIN